MTSAASAAPYTFNLLRARSARWFADVDSILERWFWPILVTLTAILFAAILAADFRLQLWSDELFGLYVARSPSLSQIAAMTLAGVDITPPLYNTIVHSLLPFLPSEALAIRLPSTIGFCAMIVAVSGYARRRLPAAYAIIAGLLAAAMMIVFASEGRAYGLVVGLAGVSLFLWSLAAERRNRRVTLPLLAASVAAMTALHYFAIFFPACLFVAQLVDARAERKLDVPLAIAVLAPAAIVIAVHYPFIAATHRYIGHMWSPASLSSITTSYKSLLQWPAAVFALTMLIATFTTGVEALSSRKTPAFPARELTALVLIALAPIGVVIVVMFTTHFFTYRYVLWSTVGVALLSAITLHRFARQNLAIGPLIVFILIAGLAGREVSRAREWSRPRESGPMLAALLALPNGDQPILLTDAHVFLELTHYGPEALRRRLVYPICRDLEFRYLGYDTDAIDMAALFEWTNLRGVDCDKALEPGRDYIVAMTQYGFLPWPAEDKSFVATPLHVDPRGAMIFRARRVPE